MVGPMMDPTFNGYLQDPAIAKMLFAVLLEKLGGTAVVTQEDVDRVAYCIVDEIADEDGLTYRLRKPNVV